MISTICLLCFLYTEFVECRWVRNKTEVTVVLFIDKLQNRDMGTFQKANAALHDGNIHVFLSQNNISEWLVEVQDKLREISHYKGLLILWDEFTDVMEDSIGIQVLKALQTIVQKFANEENAPETLRYCAAMCHSLCRQ